MVRRKKILKRLLVLTDLLMHKLVDNDKYPDGEVYDAMAVVALDASVSTANSKWGYTWTNRMS